MGQTHDDLERFLIYFVEDEHLFRNGRNHHQWPIGTSPTGRPYGPDRSAIVSVGGPIAIRAVGPTDRLKETDRSEYVRPVGSLQRPVRWQTERFCMLRKSSRPGLSVFSTSQILIRPVGLTSQTGRRLSVWCNFILLSYACPSDRSERVSQPVGHVPTGRTLCSDRSVCNPRAHLLLCTCVCT